MSNLIDSMLFQKNPYGIPDSFAFPNSLSRDDSIRHAFELHGLIVADIHRVCLGIWTWVLCTNCELWLLDKSHGGGCMFIRDSK